jgi:hypothetical protein
MLIMDSKIHVFIFKMYIYICYYSKYWNEVLLKKMSFKKSYDVLHWAQKVSPSFVSLSHALSFTQWNNEKSGFE